jgi:hypothetical protein
LKKTIRAEATPDAWDPEALYAKAQRYAERMFRNNSDDAERALWSSMALELLARAALANIHPTLLADSKKNANANLYSALGLPVKEEEFSPTSISMTEVFQRLNQLLPEFIKEQADFCTKHAGHRNAELHSGQLPFDGLKNWEGKFYRACEILLNSMGLKLDDLIGGEQTKVARKQIAAETDKRAKAVLRDVDAYKKKWEALDAAERTKRVAEAKAWATRQRGHRVECPACASPSLVLGEPVSAPERSIEDDEITETQTMLPHQFECIACGLKITGLSRLSAVGLGEKYKTTHVFDAHELYADDDDRYVGYEDDNNEPF